MISVDITEKGKNLLNEFAIHPLQSFEWGEFRKKTGIKVLRKAFFQKNKLVFAMQMTLHKIPSTPWYIGYVPKTPLPTADILSEIKTIAEERKCIFVQFEPSVLLDDKTKQAVEALALTPAAHPLFTRYTFVLDLTLPDETLLKNMHHKTRYNIKVANRYGVTVQEDNSDHAFSAYLWLTEETTKRQGFYAHTSSYHTMQWKTLPHTAGANLLSSHLLVARYKGEIVTTWILFVFKDTLYYPYGASSSAHRETMASNLMMWEAIQFGKRLGLKKFDMWGALKPDANAKDSWYGFHRFKQGYGPQHTEFIGSYDLVVQPFFYKLYKVVDELRWMLLTIKSR